MTALQAPERPVTSAPHYATGASGIYTVVVALFCGLLLISNVGATKLIGFGPIITDGGAFLFPLTYILGDVLAEVYGMSRARRAILVGFILAFLASVTFLAVGAAPPAADYTNNEAFQAVLGFVPRIVVASLCGYLAGQFLNAYVLVKIKRYTAEGKMWARLVGSTVVGEFADTALFCVIAFAGVLTPGNLAIYTVQGYVYKVGVEIVFLPVTYLVIRAIKRREPSYRGPSDSTVKQLRVVVEADDLDAAVRFYRDELGMIEQATHQLDGEARTVLLDAGRATLELSNPSQQAIVDMIEVGHRVAPPIRVSFEVDDATQTTARLLDAGADQIAPPTETPWHSVTARLAAPAELQIAVFSDLASGRRPPGHSSAGVSDPQMGSSGRDER